MKAGKITLTALFLSFSFILSILEGLVPIAALIPIPGVKLGFANIAVMASLIYCGRLSALCVVIFRPLLSFILFGNVTSLILSLSGGIVSYAVLIFTIKLYGKAFSFGGISVISAVCHSIGQIVAASLIVTSGAIYSYLPLLCAASAVTGIINGNLMNMIISRIKFKRTENV